MFFNDLEDLNDILFGDMNPLQDLFESWETSQLPSESDTCQKCGRSFKDPIRNGCNPLLSFAGSPSKQMLKMTSVACDLCDLRDMYVPNNKYSKDWEKGAVIVNMSEVLPIKEEFKMLESGKENLEMDQIWNQVMIKKEKRSDYGSDSNFSSLNEFSDDFSDFIYSDDPGSSIFSDIMKSEDSFDDEDKMIDVVSIDQSEVLPGCATHSAQVAQMHNYSTPMIHHDSYHTPLGIRNLARIQKKQRLMDDMEDEEEDDWTPNSSDTEDRGEERCHMLSSTRVIKRRVMQEGSTPIRQHGRRGRKPLTGLKCSTSARKRYLSEERDYVPEQKRRKEFDDEKREQHNVLERIRRCEMSNLIIDIQKLLPSLRGDKKHSKVVVLDAAASFARNESKNLELLINKEKQLDACIAKLRRVCSSSSSQES